MKRVRNRGDADGSSIGNRSCPGGFARPSPNGSGGRGVAVAQVGLPGLLPYLETRGEIGRRPGRPTWATPTTYGGPICVPTVPEIWRGPGNCYPLWRTHLGNSYSGGLRQALVQEHKFRLQNLRKFTLYFADSKYNAGQCFASCRLMTNRNKLASMEMPRPLVDIVQ